jgi:Flp pilus assembly protein TadD
MMFPRLVSLLLLWLFSAVCWAETVNGTATVLSLQGKAEYRTGLGGDWRPVVVQQQIQPGQFLRTAAHSRLALLLSDRTQVRLNENTVLEVMAVAAAPRTAGQTKFRQLAGRSWVQSKTPPRDLKWETPTATAGIRGTDWEMEVAEDGRSTLSVFSGEVAFANDLGGVNVGANEQAVVEQGKAPVKRLVQNLKERVQWVTAYAMDPVRHIALTGDDLPSLRQRLGELGADDAETLLLRGRVLADLGRWSEAERASVAVLAARPGDPDAALGLAFAALRRGDLTAADKWLAMASSSRDVERLAYADAAAKIIKQDIVGAQAALEQWAQRPDLAQPVPWLLQADIAAWAGRAEAGLAQVQAGLARFPDHPRLLAEQARLLLAADRAAEAAVVADQAIAADLGSFDGWLARADIARREGEAGKALAAYDLAIALKPDDDRPWFGRGVVHGEREYVREARADLAQALALNPSGLGYEGELGTLETANREYATAEAAYRAALAADPADFVALTGLGLMELQRGQSQAALDAFLKAGVMEPRYARVHVYTAAAYYQQGDVKQAESELARAAELDDKDPLPHFMAAMIHSDQFRPADAVDAARAARERLPFLKSLNQLANDQQGSANLGQAFAYLGMEEWARSYAQDSYNPFWAGSHLFLADRYTGLYTKNSELFQGLISDPTVFGASNRFKNLVPSPTFNLGASLRYTRSDDVDGFSPQVEMSGYRAEPKPWAWYLGYEGVDWDLFHRPYDLDVFTAALGVKPSHDTGLFLFADASRQDSQPVGTVNGLDYDLDDRLDTRRLDLGFHYKLRPDSQVWLKAGYFQSEEDTAGILGVLPYFYSPIQATTEVGLPEFAFRHSFATTGGHQISWGMDLGWRGTDAIFRDDVFGDGTFLLGHDYEITENSWDAYLSDVYQFSSYLTLEGSLVVQKYRGKATDIPSLILPPDPPDYGTPSMEENDHDQLSPRLGLIYRPDEQTHIRLAWQNWIRPAGMSTLGPVATAGIPLDDKLVMRGGELNRIRLQGEWEATPRTFLMGYLDYKDIDNNRFSIRPFAVSDLESLGKLRPRDYGQLMRDDLYEFVDAPDYAGGEVGTVGLTVNQMLGREWGVMGRYIYTDSRNSDDSSLDIPYLPRHTAAVGATWVHPSGWYVAGLLAYRSSRFSDEANTQLIEEGVSGDLDVFWESRDKHWLLRFSANDLFDEAHESQYTAEVNYRF